jgi:hypothetical protein
LRVLGLTLDIALPRGFDKMSDLKYCSELMTPIEARLDVFTGDHAAKPGLPDEMLNDLNLGKVEKFKLTELESFARRAGISCNETTLESCPLSRLLLRLGYRTW